MTVRTLSVRVEVIVNARDDLDARSIGASLAEVSAQAIRQSPLVQEVRFSSAVLRAAD